MANTVKIGNPLTGKDTNFSNCSFIGTKANNVEAFTRVSGLPFDITHHATQSLAYGAPNSESLIAWVGMQLVGWIAPLKSLLSPNSSHVSSSAPPQSEQALKPKISSQIPTGDIPQAAPQKDLIKH